MKATARTIYTLELDRDEVERLSTCLRVLASQEALTHIVNLPLDDCLRAGAQFPQPPTLRSAREFQAELERLLGS